MGKRGASALYVSNKRRVAQNVGEMKRQSRPQEEERKRRRGFPKQRRRRCRAASCGVRGILLSMKSHDRTGGEGGVVLKKNLFPAVGSQEEEAGNQGLLQDSLRMEGPRKEGNRSERRVEKKTG